MTASRAASSAAARSASSWRSSCVGLRALGAHALAGGLQLDAGSDLARRGRPRARRAGRRGRRRRGSDAASRRGLVAFARSPARRRLSAAATGLGEAGDRLREPLALGGGRLELHARAPERPRCARRARDSKSRERGRRPARRRSGRGRASRGARRAPSACARSSVVTSTSLSWAASRSATSSSLLAPAPEPPRSTCSAEHVAVAGDDGEAAELRRAPATTARAPRGRRRRRRGRAAPSTPSGARHARSRRRDARGRRGPRAAGARRRRRRRSRRVRRRRRARVVEGGDAGVPVVGEHGVGERAERGGDRGLVAGLDLDVLGDADRGCRETPTMPLRAVLLVERQGEGARAGGEGVALALGGVQLVAQGLDLAPAAACTAASAASTAPASSASSAMPRVVRLERERARRARPHGAPRRRRARPSAARARAWVGGPARLRRHRTCPARRPSSRSCWRDEGALRADLLVEGVEGSPARSPSRRAPGRAASSASAIAGLQPVRLVARVVRPCRRDRRADMPGSSAC